MIRRGASRALRTKVLQGLHLVATELQKCIALDPLGQCFRLTPWSTSARLHRLQRLCQLIDPLPQSTSASFAVIYLQGKTLFRQRLSLRLPDESPHPVPAIAALR
jgi:hypothetical protein